MPKSRAAEGDRISLVDAAHALRISYDRAHRLVLLQSLDGIRGPDGRSWLVTTASVERVRRELAAVA